MSALFDVFETCAVGYHIRPRSHPHRLCPAVVCDLALCRDDGLLVLDHARHGLYRGPGRAHAHHGLGLGLGLDLDHGLLCLYLGPCLDRDLDLDLDHGAFDLADYFCLAHPLLRRNRSHRSRRLLGETHTWSCDCHICLSLAEICEHGLATRGVSMSLLRLSCRSHRSPPASTFDAFDCDRIRLRPRGVDIVEMTGPLDLRYCSQRERGCGAL